MRCNIPEPGVSGLYYDARRRLNLSEAAKVLCTAKRIRQLAQCVVLTLLLCLVAGCANQGAPRSLHPINPLFLDDRVLLAAQVPTQIVTPDLLAID